MTVAIAVAAAVCPPADAFALAAGIDAAKRATVAVHDPGEGNVGSGVVVAQGYVLTAAHVTDGVTRAGLSRQIALGDGTTYTYTVEKTDRDRDLALMRVEGLTAPAITWGDSSAVSSGEDVFALGFSLGSQTLVLTKGVVSAASQELDGFEYIQTDATINPGNSGGPLVDDQGALLGINVVKIAGGAVENVGLAVPARAAREFLFGTPAAPGAAPGAAAPVPGGGGGGSAADPGAGLAILVLVAALAGGAGYAVLAARKQPPGVVVPQPIAGPVASPLSGPVFRYEISGPGGNLSGSIGLPVVMGRASTADITVADPEMSRHHVRMVASGEAVRVQDLGSLNGIQIGGQKIKHVDLLLEDSVVIGMTTLRRVG